DLLQLRYGRISTYDILNTDLGYIETELTALRGRLVETGASPTVTVLVDQYEVAFLHKRELLDAFSPENAALVNSQRLLPRAASSLAAQGDVPESLLHDLDHLVSRVLLYELTSDEELAKEAQQDVERLAGNMPAQPALAEALGALLAHAQLILQQAPRV